jgi:hypothetical protein
LSLGFHLPAWHALGHESSISVAAFKETFGSQSLVDTKDCVLIHGQLSRKRAD